MSNMPATQTLERPFIDKTFEVRVTDNVNFGEGGVGYRSGDGALRSPETKLARVAPAPGRVSSKEFRQ